MFSNLIIFMARVINKDLAILQRNDLVEDWKYSMMSFREKLY